jgi:nucleoside-specific outer membrane channel protein Tsx
MATCQNKNPHQLIFYRENTMKSMTKNLTGLATAVALTSGISLQVSAADWSTTELQLQYGDLDKAFQGGGSDAETDGSTVLTFQHASGWEYGDNFFFIDYINYGRTDYEQANGMDSTSEFYGELYSNFSLGKITGNDLSFAFVKDVGIIAGFNFVAEVDTWYALPGVRLALDLPGFAFANLDTMAYLQMEESKPADGVSINEDDSWMIDFNWAYPFTIGSTKWSLEGHVEYIKGVDQKTRVAGVGVFDEERDDWVLAQPQLRLDLGNFWGTPDRLFVGIEYQYWSSKLGDDETDESVIQALAVWRL